MSERGSTRRELVARTFAAASGAAAGGAVGLALAADPAAGSDDTPPPTDAQALSKALVIERLMVLAYRRVLSSGKLEPDIERAIAPLLGHEVQHAAAVAAALAAMGVKESTAPLDLSAAAAVLSDHNIPGSLTNLDSQSDAMKLLVDLESLAEGVYFTALKTLSTAALQRLAAQILACEAQHWTAVSGLRNPGAYVKAIPWPFVTGSS